MNRPVGEICGARTKRTGKPCRRAAGSGTDHVGFGTCKHHGGAMPNHIKHAARLEAAWRAALAEQIDPSIRKIAALRDGAQAEQVQLAAARDLLDRNGVRVSEEQAGSRRIVFEWVD